MKSFLSKKDAQGSVEIIMSFSMILLLFIIVILITFQKQGEAHDIQVSLDAQRITKTLSENINSISKNGDGYYTYFTLPNYVYGYTDYDFSISSNFLEISYSGINWESQLVTDNITMTPLVKGHDSENCIMNENGRVVVSNVCGSYDAESGEVVSCDPGDIDDCATCYSNQTPTIISTSRSVSQSFGCSTEEWHLYKLVPARDGTLSISFTSDASVSGELRTDLIFYDYTTNGCSLPYQYFNMEPSHTEEISVSGGNSYIIALDSDSPNCGQGGSYILTTELI
jgi:hypothetical protein